MANAVQIATYDGAAVTTDNPLPVSSAGGGGGAVTVADGANVAQGAQADSSATTDTGTFSIVALQKRELEKLTNLLTRTPAALLHGGTPVVLLDSTGAELSYRSTGYGAVASFTPAATSHTAGDCNGAAATFTALGPVSGEVIITTASLMIFGATAEVSTWRLYLYNVTPPSAYADDAAWDILTGDRASYLGYVDLGTAVDLGGTQWVETSGINKQITLAASGNAFGYLVNGTTLTPAAVVHQVTLHTTEA